MVNNDSSGISPTFAAFISGAASTVLTVAATLVSLRSDASKSALFDVLNWVMYAASAGLALFLAWVVADAMAGRVQKLRQLSDIDAHMPRSVRIRRRNDTFTISSDGSAVGEVECEVEADSGVTVPWLSYPLLASTSSSDPEWRSIELLHLSVEATEYDTQQSFIRKARIHLADPARTGVIVEEGVVRVPISLDSTHRTCTFKLRYKLPNAFSAIMDEEWCIADVAYITDELNVYIRGAGDLEVFCSPRSNYRVQASQFSGEIVDPTESQLQSETCRTRDGIHWRSTTAKIGYRYEITIAGREQTS